MIDVRNLVMFAWVCRSVWNGRYRISTAEPDWQGLVTMPRGEILSLVPVS